MHSLSRLFLAAAFIALVAIPVFSQDDAEGVADIPYFSRMPHFRIIDGFVKEFDEYQLTDGKKLFSVEGKVYQTTYGQKEDGSAIASDLQIRRNIIAAVKKIGGTIIFEGKFFDFPDTRSGANIVTAKLKKGESEVWFELIPIDGEYVLTAIEKQTMKQDISATDMLQALNNDGRIALQINFDTGKATIRDESRPVIDQIVQLLNENQDLTLSIEGHTDNVGDAKSNKVLSDQRAKSVMNAIVKAGIDAKRLSAAGYGMEKPIADNSTDEGRAKNRRVELVKK